MHLLSLEILESKFCLKKGTKIRLKPITLLIGDQGTGKSTLLWLLQSNKNLKVELSDDVNINGIDTYFFDTEKMNPRTSSLDNYTTPGGYSKGIGVGAAIASHLQSHGEVLARMTVDALKDTKDCVMFLDEPESGLSIQNQYRLVKAIKAAVKRNVQFIIATHCLPLIESMEQIYSMESLEWVTPTKYLNKFRKVSYTESETKDLCKKAVFDYIHANMKGTDFDGGVNSDFKTHKKCNIDKWFNENAKLS